MLTRRGWGVAFSTAAFIGGGRLFGLEELYVLAVVALVLCASAIAFVAWHAIEIDAIRTLHPPRVNAGTPSRVELEIRNKGRRRTPVLAVRDPFDKGWRWARFLLAPVVPGASSRAAYRLPTERRGIYDIGPLEVAVTDPFGLASTTFNTAAVTQLTVYPRIEEIHPLPFTHGYDPHSGSEHPTAFTGAGEDFYALRPYEVGDDTRRVHWLSTARLDDLMVRQDEMPWQTRATILLDVRAAVHSAATFETAVSAAASIHHACRQRHALIRMVLSDGLDSGFAGGHAHAQAILEHLATVATSTHDRLAGVAASLRRAGNGGALAVVTTTRARPSDLDTIARLRGRYGCLVLVIIDVTGSTVGPVPRATAVVRLGPEDALAPVWDNALALTEVRR